MRQDAPGTCATRMSATILGLTALAAVAALTPARPATAGVAWGCLGDCDGDGTVDVAEVLRAVRIALDLSPREDCLAGQPSRSYGIDVLVTAVLHALDGCTVTGDFSGFEHFTLRREPSYGFCPPTDTVYDATIERRIDGTYLLTSSMLEERRPGVDPCLINRVGRECLVRRPRPCRILTAGEAERVRAAFARVRFHRSPGAECLRIVVDDCMISRLEWDGVRLNDFECSGSRVDVDITNAISELLESLDTGIETTCDENLCGDGARDSREECDDGNVASGDGCARNCTIERELRCRLDSERSGLIYDQVSPSAAASLSGEIALRVGAARDEDVISRHGLVIADRGNVPVGARPADAALRPAPVTGLACLCVRGTEREGGVLLGDIRCGGPAATGTANLLALLAFSVLDDGGLCSVVGPEPDGSCLVADYGLDCLPCTDDDRVAATDASAELITGPVRGTDPPLSGSLFDCTAVAAGGADALSGTVLAGRPYTSGEYLGQMTLACE